MEVAQIMIGQQMDFLILLAGVPFVVLAASMYALARETKNRMTWEWMCAFACLFCLHIWMEVAEMVSGALRSGIAENLVLLLSYLCLFGFGLTQMRLTARRFVLLYLAPVTVALALSVPGGSHVEKLITGLMGLPGTAVAAYALWIGSKGTDSGIRRACRAFGLLLPALPVLELALGASVSTDLRAGVHCAPIYISYIAIGTVLLAISCALDALLLQRHRGRPALWDHVSHVTTVAFLLLLSLGGGWILARHLGAVKYSEIKARAQRRDGVLADNINWAHHIAAQVAATLASNNTLAAAVTGTRSRTEAAEEAIKPFVASFEGTQVLLLDAMGVVVAGAENAPIGQSLADRRYFQLASQGYPSSAVLVEEHGGRAMVAASPIYVQSLFAGAVVVKSGLKLLEEGLPQEANVVLASPSGVVWMSSNPDWLYRRLWSGPSEPSEDLDLVEPGDAVTSSSRPLQAGEEAFARSEPYLVDRQSAGPPGWSLISLSPLDDVLRSRGIALLVTGAAITILLAVGTAARQRNETVVAQREQSTLAGHMAQMERLISVLSHDLRTPLAASRSTVDYLLIKGGLDDESSELLSKVGDHQMRMADMVTRMLDAMRIRSGAMEWAWGEVDVRQVLEAARDTVAALPVHRPEVSVELKVAAGVSTIRGDAQSIRRLVENLAANALRYTATGSVTICADLAEESHLKWLRISVRDTGEGMSRETMALLGQPFLLGGAQKRSGSGLGVGISSGICAAHGGRLTVRSRPGAGSEFVAWLRTDLPSPIRSASEPRVEIVS